MTDLQNEDVKQNSSGGVKTEEGKEISKYNALKHGVLQFALTDYENNLYRDVLDQFMAEFSPVGALETILVERGAMYYVKLYRISKAENEYMQSALNPRIVESSLMLMPMVDEIVKNDGYHAKITKDNIKELTNTFQRYEITAENRFFKTLHELERIQRMRKGERLPPPVNVDVTNSSSSFGENDKLTD